MYRSLPRHRAAVISAGDAILPAVAGRLAHLLVHTLHESVAVVEAVIFWIAALFPVAYLPLLAALQYAPLDPAIIAGIVAAHLLALVVGHRHEPTHFDRDATPRTPKD